MRQLLDILAMPGDADLVAGEVRATAGYAGRRDASSRAWILLLTHGGRGRLDAADLSQLVDIDAVALIRPGGSDVAWQVAPDAEAWSFTWFSFRPRHAWMEWLEWPRAGDGVGWLSLARDAERAGLIVDRLRDVYRLSTGPHPRRDALAANAFEQALLWCDAMRPVDSGRPPDDRVALAAEWMCRHLGRPVTLDRVAEHVGLSVSRLAHRFRDEMGVPPLQYLERQRMRRARELLSMTSLTLREVAADVGFESLAYFATRFRKATGLLPEAYRRRAHESAEIERVDAQTFA